MSAPRRAAALGVIALTACSGYADLPIPVRELAGIEVESAFVSSEGPGRVQIALELPSDTVGPTFVVGHPASASDDARVIAWAAGPCPGGPAPVDARLRLCLAVEVTGAHPRGAIPLTVVAETRGDGRRFTCVGSVSPE